MKIGKKEFSLGEKTCVMGILNITPDSFSDGGRYNYLHSAMEQTEKMIKDGADIIDVGGESTRPGYIPVSDEEEIQRVAPIIREIKKNFDTPVSIDTYKSCVARAALDEGADMLNDIWGFKADEQMAELAVRYDVPVCLMHNRDNTEYRHFMREVVQELKESVAIAKKHGVKKDRIILDPGVGFGKTYEQNLSVMKHLEDIVMMGYPVLLGASRKSVIGYALDLPVSEREEGTIAISVLGACMGCDFVRVHDVKKNVRALRMMETILHAR